LIGIGFIVIQIQEMITVEDAAARHQDFFCLGYLGFYIQLTRAFIGLSLGSWFPVYQGDI
jgi:hypothetical protein